MTTLPDPCVLPGEDPEPPVTARCGCGAAATHQPLYRRGDGTHFFGGPRCEVHAEPLGPPPHALGVVIVDNTPIRPAPR